MRAKIAKKISSLKNYLKYKIKGKYFNYLYGIYGEIFAIIFFTIKGYLLISRRHRNKITEIDLIFYKKNTLIFIEVKSRTNIADFYEIVKNRQLNNIKKASELFLKDRKKLRNYYSRFDIFILEGFFKFKHIPNI